MPPTRTARVTVRSEQVADREAIHDLTRHAFAPMVYAAGNEQDLIDALRRAGALVLSLVAVDAGGAVVGHVAFSPAGAPGGAAGWYALGPVAVLPALQRRGIGRQLIEDGLRHLVARDAAGCILVGDPRYYARFGFTSRPTFAPAGVPAAYFMILLLAGPVPASPLAFQPLFEADQNPA